MKLTKLALGASLIASVGPTMVFSTMLTVFLAADVLWFTAAQSERWVTTRALVALLVLVAGSEGGAEVMESAQREAIMTALGARVRSFEAAERARDPEQLLAHYASGPEFHFYHDGRRANYDVIAGGVRKALPGVRSLEVAYSDVEVTVLSAEYALVSATFRRDLVIHDTGAAVHHEGGVSWIWRNTAGQWLIVHGHISHPLEPVK